MWPLSGTAQRGKEYFGGDCLAHSAQKVDRGEGRHQKLGTQQLLVLITICDSIIQVQGGGKRLENAA